MTLRSDLVHAATAFDRKESSKRYYNVHALGLMLKRIDDVIERIEGGADAFATIADAFNGPLLLALGKVVRPALKRADVVEIDRNRTKLFF